MEVVTAGFRATRVPVTAPTLEAAAELGIDLREHVSRPVDRALVASADLLIGMERLHVREAVVVEPSVWRRAFTLRDLVRRAEAVDPRAPGQSLRSWLELLSAGRDRMAVMGSSDLDDVRDPTTDPSVDHRSTAADIADLVRRFVARAWPI